MSYEREVVIPIHNGVRIRYRSDRGPNQRYSVTLETTHSAEWLTIRSWDNSDARDEHHMHRYTRTSGKQPATVLTRPTVNEAIHAAIEDARHAWEAILNSWDR
jgi:hypothetical protein